MIIYLYLFIAGLVLGSFYTVVGLRGPLNKSIIKPRSHCENCNHQLSWYELIPVLSYIIQKGKCRSCNQKISIIYPLIELLCGFLFCLSYYIYGFAYQTLIMLVLSSLLIIIFVSDFKYYIILDSPLIISSALIFLIKLIFSGYRQALISLLCGLTMFLVMYLIKLLGDKIFQRESLGGGDIKLSFVIGLTLNIRLAFISIVLASFIALPYALYLMKKDGNKEMPFGPFLVSGLLVTFLLSNYIINFLNILFCI